MKELLDAAPKAIAVASFVVLLITVVHEYGYFFVVGSHLQAIATTYDYLANALVWLPAAMGAIISLQGIEYAISIKDGAIKLRSPFYFGWAAAALGLLLYLLLGGVTAALAVTLFGGFTTIYFLTRDFKATPERLSNYRLTLLGIYLVPLAFGYGVTTAYSDLAKSNDVYAVDQKDGQGRPRQLVLLRIFEKGVLVRDLPAERVEFLRWDSINSMSRLLRTPRPTTGYLCSWLNVACGRREAEPLNTP